MCAQVAHQITVSSHGELLCHS